MPERCKTPAPIRVGRGRGPTELEPNMRNYIVLPRCTVQLAHGEFCDTEAAEDMPFPICLRHAEELVHHIQPVWDPAEEADSVTELLTCLGSVIYAIRCGDMIKIGYSTNLARRAAVLGGYANLLAWRPGTLADEQAIHASLDGLAVQGREYYPAAPRVLAVVNEMRDSMGLEVLSIA